MINSFICLFVDSFIHLPIYSFIRLPIYSFIRLLFVVCQVIHVSIRRSSFIHFVTILVSLSMSVCLPTQFSVYRNQVEKKSVYRNQVKPSYDSDRLFVYLSIRLSR